MAKIKEKSSYDQPKSGGAGGKILAFFLGILMGIILLVGSLGGAGFILYNKIMKQPVKDTVNMVDSSGNLYKTLFDQTEGFLNPKYAENLVTDMLGDLGEDFDALSQDGATLAELSEISPKINGIVEGLLEATSQFGILKEEFEDKDGVGARKTFMEQPLSDLSTYIGDRVKNTPLADMMKSIGDSEEITDPLMLALCYGEEGEDWKRDEGGKIQTFSAPTTLASLAGGTGMSDTINRLSFDTILSATGAPAYEDPMKSVIAYGPESHYTVDYDGEGNKIGVTMNQITYLVVDGKLCDAEGEEIDGATFDGDKMTATLPEKDGTKTVYSLEKEGDIYKAFTTDGDGNKTPAKYKKTKVRDLSGDMLSLVDDVYLKDVLVTDDGNTHKVLLTVAYGVGGYAVGADGKVTQTEDAVLRTIGDLRKNNQGIFDDIPLTDVMGEQLDSNISKYLLYGKEGIHYEIVDGKATMLRMRILLCDGKLYNAYGEELTGHSLVDGIYSDGTTSYQTETTALKQTIRIEVSTDVFQNKEADVYYLKDMDGKELYFHKTNLGDMSGNDNVISNLNTRLTLGELFDSDDVSDNIFLKHLKDETIDSLPEAISNLAIIDVYEDMVYDTNNDGIYSDEEKTNKVPARTWWYLLHNEEECHKNHCSNGATCSNENCTAPRTCKKDNNNNCVEKYTVKDMNKLINNMTTNMQGATLNQLNEDGMISLSAETLETAIITKITVPGKVFDVEGAAGKTKLGELTVAEILTYNSNVLKTIQELQNHLNP